MTSCGRLRRIDKLGCEFEVGECGPDFSCEIKHMYDRFAALAISQGLPPMEKDMRDCWVDKLIGLGRNFIVWQHGDVVGHAAVIPDFDRGDGEFIIFVSEPNRNRGLGTALTALAIDVSRAAGLKRLWLTVESFNFRAIRLYRKAGFVFVNQSEREMTMLRTL